MNLFFNHDHSQFRMPNEKSEKKNIQTFLFLETVKKFEKALEQHVNISFSITASNLHNVITP